MKKSEWYPHIPITDVSVINLISPFLSLYFSSIGKILSIGRRIAPAIRNRKKTKANGGIYGTQYFPAINAPDANHMDIIIRIYIFACFI